MFCTQCAWPLCFYFVFIYCSQMLKSQFEYSVLDIIKHNFVISIFPVVSCFIRAKLSKKLHPLILFKYSLKARFLKPFIGPVLRTRLFGTSVLKFVNIRHIL